MSVAPSVLDVLGAKEIQHSPPYAYSLETEHAPSLRGRSAVLSPGVKPGVMSLEKALVGGRVCQS